jgi:hypothetical protein
VLVAGRRRPHRAQRVGMWQCLSACEMTCLIQGAYCSFKPQLLHIMPVVAWPSQWIDKTFTSRTRTEELLRPELDDSLVPADFEKAVDFLSGNQRYWKVRVPTFQHSGNAHFVE